MNLINIIITLRWKRKKEGDTLFKCKLSKLNNYKDITLQDIIIKIYLLIHTFIQIIRIELKSIFHSNLKYSFFPFLFLSLYIYI